MAYLYSAGTVSVEAGGTVVTGVGTMWLTALKAYDSLFLNGQNLPILSVDGNTSLTIRPWPAVTVAGGSYVVRYDSPLRFEPAYLATQVTALLNKLRLLAANVPYYEVVSLGLNAPPASPALDDSYVIGTAPTGAWAGRAKNIATWTGTAWEFAAPDGGWHAYSAATNAQYAYVAGSWQLTDGVASVGGQTGTVTAEQLWTALNASSSFPSRLSVDTNANPAADLDTVFATGFTAADGLTANKPPGANNWVVLTIGRLPTIAVQIAFDRNGTDTFANRSNSGAGWTAWKKRDKEILTSARTYYVRQDGSDSNNGQTNSSGGAFLTLNRARDAVYALDLNGFNIAVVAVASATPYAGTQWSGLVTGARSSGAVTIQGSTSTPGDTIITGNNTNAVRANMGANIVVKNLEVRTTGTSNACFLSSENGNITYDNINFGASTGPHKEATTGGRMIFVGGVGYFITGNAVSHEHITNGGYVLNFNGTCTLVGTRAFSAYFTGSAIVGGAQYVSFTYAGSGATGQRYLVHKNSVIDTGGGGANYFPGSVAGATATGGQYIP